jgi:Mn2+/Fe2+ NRAMP family transporter
LPDTTTPPDDTRPATIDPYARSAASAREPPVGWKATLRELGPGMILVGSVVGSGELLMTTKLGAQAGFVLLWFVLLSCLIKVVVQAELTRHTISTGRTFLTVFNTLPGPSAHRPVWLNLEWMAVVVLCSLGGLAAFRFLQKEIPATGAVILIAVTTVCILWAAFISLRSRRGNSPAAPEVTERKRPALNWVTWLWLLTVLIMFVNGGAIVGAAGQAVELAFPGALGEYGHIIWSLVVAVVAGSILIIGGYQTLERISIGLVALFTLITLVCTVLLQWTDHAITPAQVAAGLTFDFPIPLTAAVIMTALAMYAGTGIGTSEMMSYTYWCVEKGYARNVGEREPSDAWPRRARGWVRVMYTDVFLTMVVYTVSTICFYFLGAAILNAKGLDPDGPATVGTIQAVYTGTLGSWAATLFVVGAFFVLFSTVISGVAGATRALSDGLAVMGIIDARDFAARKRFFHIFTAASLTIHVVTYSLLENPPLMLMITSVVAVMLYPVIGLGTLYLRYRDVDERIAPGKMASFWLWFCGIALALISPAAALTAFVVGGDEVPEVPSHTIHRTATKFTIDGQLDEPAWKAAKDVGKFKFAWWKDGKKEQTAAKLLWDDRYLYVSFRCTDAHISGEHTKRDSPVYQDDCVEVFTAPNPDRPDDYFNIEMNVRGAFLDRHHPNGPKVKPKQNWNATGVRIAIAIDGTLNDDTDTDREWILEAAIPLSNFKGVAKNTPPADGDVWHLNLNRLGGKTNPQFSQWSPSKTKTPQFHAPKDFGRVVFSKRIVTDKASK